MDDDFKNPAAVEMGRRGGKKGGDARAAALSPERRSEIALEAAQARWSRKPPTLIDSYRIVLADLESQKAQIEAAIKAIQEVIRDES